MPMTSSESARPLQLHTQLKTAIDRALVDFMTNGVTDESYAAFEQSLKDIGSEEYKAIYQAAYDRYLTRQEVAAQ